MAGNKAVTIHKFRATICHSDNITFNASNATGPDDRRFRRIEREVMTEPIKAFWFQPENKKLSYGDNRRARVGITHRVKGQPELCVWGLHASERPIDALQYANSDILYMVELSGEIDSSCDKISAQKRKYIKRIDATKILRVFARRCALINIEKINDYCEDDSYEWILRWLKTGDDKIKDAVYCAANSAANRAANRAAYCAAHSVAYSAAYWAANSAANRAAGSPAYCASYSAAYSAAYSDMNTILVGLINE